MTGLFVWHKYSKLKFRVFFVVLNMLTDSTQGQREVGESRHCPGSHSKKAHDHGLVAVHYRIASIKRRCKKGNFTPNREIVFYTGIDLVISYVSTQLSNVSIHLSCS